MTITTQSPQAPTFNPFEFYWLRRHERAADDASEELTGAIRKHYPEAVAFVTEMSMKKGEGFSTIHRLEIRMGQFDVSAYSTDGWMWDVTARSRTNYQYTTRADFHGAPRFFHAAVNALLGDALTLLAYLDTQGAEMPVRVRGLSFSWGYK